MAAIQLVSAYIGRVTGKGIAANVKGHHHISIVSVLVSLLLAAPASAFLVRPFASLQMRRFKVARVFLTFSCARRGPDVRFLSWGMLRRGFAMKRLPVP